LLVAVVGVVNPVFGAILPPLFTLIRKVAVASNADRSVAEVDIVPPWANGPIIYCRSYSTRIVDRILHAFTSDRSIS